jgi:hypothetical protein
MRPNAPNGEEPPFTAEHALHVCEIIVAARQSQASARVRDHRRGSPVASERTANSPSVDVCLARGRPNQGTEEGDGPRADWEVNRSSWK